MQPNGKKSCRVFNWAARLFAKNGPRVNQADMSELALAIAFNSWLFWFLSTKIKIIRSRLVGALGR
jgi:hypothetical protein